MQITLAARTTEVGQTCSENLTDMIRFCGKAAATCYSTGDFYDANIQNPDTADRIAGITCGNNHHRVFSQGHLNLWITGLSKMMCMLLNSMEVANACERSARYTEMEPRTEEEREVYEKFITIFSAAIGTAYGDKPGMTRAIITKLAQENARYLISVFTPSMIMWECSYREISYLLDWTEHLMSCLSGNTYFEKTFSLELEEFREKMLAVICKHDLPIEIHDNKQRYLEFLAVQVGHKGGLPKSYYGDTYTTSYEASLASVAQLHRHSSLHYEIYLDPANLEAHTLYMPGIISANPFGKDLLPSADAKLYREQYKDAFERVRKYIPQGLEVTVTEEGRTRMFLLKACERLCGRAQRETMQHVRTLMGQFIHYRDNLSSANQQLLADAVSAPVYAGTSRPVPKCKFKDFACTEPCMWGSDEAFTRLI